MWNVVRSAVVWVFGDDVVKIVLYVVGGFLILAFIESTAAVGAIMNQPWGSWWLAGVGGGAQSSSVSGSVTADRPSSGSLRVDVPPESNPLAAVVPVPTIVSAIAEGRIATLIANAMTWLGTPYRWGGCSTRGTDCSCFVMNVLASVGIQAPRVTTAQIGWTKPINAAVAVAGDLVFFDNTCSDCGPNPTHVGIYLGGGRMVDCGDPCKVEAVYGGHNARYGRVPGL